MRQIEKKTVLSGAVEVKWEEDCGSIAPYKYSFLLTYLFIMLIYVFWAKNGVDIAK